MGNKIARVFDGCFPLCRKPPSDDDTYLVFFDVAEEVKANIKSSPTYENDCKLDLEVQYQEEYKVTVPSVATIINDKSESEPKTADVATIPDNKAHPEAKTSADTTRKVNDVQIKPFVPTRMPRKSAYNWGIINTWSRHLAPESDDALETKEVFRPTVKREDLYEPQVYNVNIARPYHTEGLVEDHYTYYRCNGLRRPFNVGMVRSTLDARDSSTRPRASRGVRTKVTKSRN